MFMNFQITMSKIVAEHLARQPGLPRN